MALLHHLSPPLRFTSSPSAFLFYPSSSFYRLRAGRSVLNAFLPSNGYVSGNRSSPRFADKIYRRLESCLVVPPPAGRQPLAVVKFLGGAFVGAAPELSYSNGALLQMLVGSYFPDKIPKANVVISFNNKPASQAVPYFEQVGPVVRQVIPFVEASPFYRSAQNLSGDAWKVLLESAGALTLELDQEIMLSLAKFFDQIPSVIRQVIEGMSEFSPSPSKNREFFKNSYSVPHTLLVKFSVDAIDESDVLDDILRPRLNPLVGAWKRSFYQETTLLLASRI
ncbi:hypothetical protein HPP92_018726 [Vanilla planifolia]|uniref:Uncharacterized protein n=1 Tax=Vanilla planifolia TaxID=51239 RepID=A0A835QIM9_VANPL|nr:hypothetical protein HPP92_018726 [Vanilla planifolia]